MSGRKNLVHDFKKILDEQSEEPKTSEKIKSIQKKNNKLSNLFEEDNIFFPSQQPDSFLSPTKKRKRNNYYEYCADRHIPESNPDREACFQANQQLEKKSRNKKKGVIDSEQQNETSDKLYLQVIGRETIGRNFIGDGVEQFISEKRRSLNANYIDSNWFLPRTPVKSPRSPKYLNFTSPDSKKSYDYTLDSPNSQKYSLTPISLDSQNLLTSPRKIPRHISKVPYKVLDAPDLQDDFYLNLVDWGAQNILSVGLGTCVYLWSAQTSKVTKLCDLSEGNDTVTSVNWNSRGDNLAVGTNLGKVLTYDVQQNQLIRTYENGNDSGQHSQRVGALAWQNGILTSGSRDRSIICRDFNAPASSFRKLTSHKQEICGLKWSLDSTQLASGGNDNKLLIWDNKNSPQPLFKLDKHTAAVKAIAWSPHNHSVLASGGGTADRHIRFWNTSKGEQLYAHDTGSQVCNLAWSKHSTELVSTHGYSQNQIVIWKYTPTAITSLTTLTGHTMRVLYLAMSPDGQNIVTGAGDETLRFWNVFNKMGGGRDDKWRKNSALTIR
ncbi:hypothetical protein HK099_006313 [Clydaea vesicula]|uniref:CDC20/Fizzy WD40 domain-containing protein n=1 Tax=Clydaea vesicula TaxID=447962 RepID=A0AAD5XX19_9FUNG|nr:hypothetical protein HK099_006313 [Clydaea vesicula]